MNDRWRCTACGITISKYQMPSHLNSQRHKNQINKMNIYEDNSDYYTSNYCEEQYHELIMNQEDLGFENHNNEPRNGECDDNQELENNTQSADKCITAELLLHLFCVQKNISKQNERLLFSLVSNPQFGLGRSLSYDNFKKELGTNLPQLPYTVVNCAYKHANQKNYKPVDLAKIVKSCNVHVYDVGVHLQRYLSDSHLSAQIISTSGFDGNQYATFTTGVYFHNLVSELPPDVIPICLELYWDDTGISSRKKCGPLWLGVANCNTAVKRSPSSRMLIAVIPGGVDISNVLGEVARQVSALRLKRFYFGCSNVYKTVSVTLSLILGDSPASNGLIGLRGPTCSSPCRICLVTAANLHEIPDFNLDVNSVHEMNWSYRNREAYFEVITEVQKNHARGSMELYESKLKEIGATFYPSPLWNISGLELFKQSPYCLLHNEFLGLIPFHLDCTLGEMNSEEIKILANRILNFPQLPNLPALNADIVERKGWEGKSYTAFYRMAIFVFRGLLSDQSMLCWRAHCRYIRYLLKPAITEKKLENMMATYWQWKALFIQLYRYSQSNSNAVSKKSMNFINLHAGEHWPFMIKNFGMPADYSTQHWESLHQQVKKKEKKSNHQKPSQDISSLIIEEKLLQYSYGAIENYCEPNKSPTRLIINCMTLMNKTKAELSDPAKQCLRQHLLELELRSNYTRYSSIVISNIKYTIGDSFSVKMNDNKEFANIHAIVYIAEQVFLVAKLFMPSDPNTRIDSNQTEFYSLRLGTDYKIFTPESIRKEQILYCEEEDIYLVNFYFQ